jgi:acyl-CoA synthetase (NDP forming)
MSDLLRAVVDQARREDRAYLMEHECKQILEDLGISTTGSRVARSEDEAAQIFESVGSPLVLKILSPEIIHKSDLGGVKLDLRDAQEVRKAYREIISSFQGKQISGVSVQEMAEPGIEAIVGVMLDPTFGPILMFGLGGIFVEILQDVSLRSIPITESDADEMIKEIKGYSLLRGFRGHSADIPALKDLLLRISDLVESNPEIAEMDLNPVFLYPTGYKVADARMILGEESETSAKPVPELDLQKLFYPKSIAVIGASATKGKLGWNVFCNLINHNFEGDLYPVNPKAESVQGIKAYSRISEIKAPVDVAIVLVAASITPQVVRECCECGVKYIIVESAGFAEMGDVGSQMEQDMLMITEPYGARLLGPNCSGIINTHCSMVQSIGIVDELAQGNIGLISQAGVCAAGMLWGLRHIMDFGIIATIGNKLDINETDMLEALSMDDNINVICMYLESVKGGRRFLDVAKLVSKKKPIIALKSGRTEAGIKAVASHTASMAGNDQVYSAVFKQAGIIRAMDYEHMFNLTKAISKQPLPEKDGVFIITYAGSLGVISADAVTDNGMRLAELEPDLKEQLFDLLPDYVGGTNPVDYTFSMDAETVRKTIEIGVESADVGSFIVVLQAEILGSYVEPLADIDYKGKPIMACVAGKEFALEDVIKLENAGIPVYQTPEQCADAISVMYNYGKFVRGK